MDLKGLVHLPLPFVRFWLLHSLVCEVVFSIRVDEASCCRGLPLYDMFAGEIWQVDAFSSEFQKREKTNRLSSIILLELLFIEGLWN